MKSFREYFETKMHWMKMDMPATEVLDIKKSSHREKISLAKHHNGVAKDVTSLKKAIENLKVTNDGFGLIADLSGFDQKKLEKFLTIYQHPHDKKLLKIPTGKDPITTFRADLLNALE